MERHPSPSVRESCALAPSPDPVTASDVVSWLAADADGREPPGAPRKNKRAGKPNWMKRGGRKHKSLVAARKAHGAQHDDEYYGQLAEFDDEPRRCRSRTSRNPTLPSLPHRSALPFFCCICPCGYHFGRILLTLNTVSSPPPARGRWRAWT